MADFDSLAAAVGLAKLWQDERPDDGERGGRFLVCCSRVLFVLDIVSNVSVYRDMGYGGMV